jgi:hypothetical protein
MARLAHFPNLNRLRLTIVDRIDEDPAVRAERDEFLDRHPAFCPERLDLEVLIDGPYDPDSWTNRRARPAHDEWRNEDERVVEYAVNAEFVSMDSGVDAPDLLARLAKRLEPERHARPLAALVVCFEADEANFEAALRLKAALEQLHADGVLSRRIPIYAYISDEEGLERLLTRQQSGRGMPIVPFGRRTAVANHAEITRRELRLMAQAVHEYYRENFGGDPWKDLPPSMRASNEDAAAHGDIKLDALGWTRRPLPRGEPSDSPIPAERIELLAQAEHNRWMGERLSAGWRYGEPIRGDGYDNRRRLTFCAWQHVTTERSKDEEHVRALKSMYRAAGYDVGDGADVSRRPHPPARDGSG